MRSAGAIASILAVAATSFAAPNTANADAPDFASAHVEQDFNGDGRADLAIASARNRGEVHIVFGSPSGLVAAGSQKWTPATIPVVPDATTYLFGQSLAPGDFDHDGYCDLAIGADGTMIDGQEDAGAVVILYGSAGGLTTTGSTYLTRRTLQGPVQLGDSDRFGQHLEAADFGRGSFADLAISSGPEGVGGAVHVFYGSAGGLTAAGGQVWSQASPGIRGSNGGGFGRALAGADFNGSGPDDLAIGVPEATVGKAKVAGAVQVIFGSADGLTAAGDQLWHQDSPGIKGKATSHGFFGFGLVGGHFAGRAAADLAIESWGESRSVSVLYGSKKGLTASGDQLWNKSSSGLPRGSFGGENLLPLSLSVADFGHNPAAGVRDDLAVGVNTSTDVGGVLVLYGATKGLKASGSELWTQASPGVPGTAEKEDAFGSSLASGRFDGGRYAALAAASPTESVQHVYPAGTVHVLAGRKGGLQTGGIQVWTNADLGDQISDSYLFGRALGATGP
jgi:disulfide bond formation protein DsbB